MHCIYFSSSWLELSLSLINQVDAFQCYSRFLCRISFLWRLLDLSKSDCLLLVQPNLKLCFYTEQDGRFVPLTYINIVSLEVQCWQEERLHRPTLCLNIHACGHTFKTDLKMWTYPLNPSLSFFPKLISSHVRFNNLAREVKLERFCLCEMCWISRPTSFCPSWEQNRSGLQGHGITCYVMLL